MQTSQGTWHQIVLYLLQTPSAPTSWHAPLPLTLTHTQRNHRHHSQVFSSSESRPLLQRNFPPHLVCQRYLTPVPSRHILKILRLLVLNFTTSLNNPEQFQQPTRSQWQCSDDYGFVIVKIIFTEMLDVLCMYSRKCCPYVMYTYIHVYIQVASDCIKWENVIIEKTLLLCLE